MGKLILNITDTAGAESKSVTVGLTSTTSLLTWGHVRATNIHLTASTTTEIMSRRIVGGQREGNKTIILRVAV